MKTACPECLGARRDAMKNPCARCSGLGFVPTERNITAKRILVDD